MDEQFDDNRLTNRIREVFDNYEHPSADHGWEQFRKKYPAEGKDRKVAMLWWSSAAAIILLMLGVGLWFKGQDKTPQNNIVLKPAAKPLEKDSSTNLVQPNQTPAMASTETPTDTAVKKPYQSSYVHSLAAGPVMAYQVRHYKEASTLSNAEQPVKATEPENNQANNTPVKDNGIVYTTTPIDTVKAQQVQQPQLSQTTKPTESATQQPQQTTIAANNNTKRSGTIMDMFEREKGTQTAQRQPTDKGDKKVTFSVFATTYFNYAEGSTNQVNAGAGFASDFRLTKKLKLSTGVALAQNSLNYGSANTAPQAAFAVAAKAPVLRQGGFFAMSAALPVFRNYNVSMLGIDVPINLKYEFNPDKTDAFISAGLSSGTFFNENYTYRYTYSNGTVSNAADAGQDQSQSVRGNSNFYFGRLLNLSFGIGYPIGTNRLIVEPFVKYPLGGLGAQDIRFGSGGVNLKFSFKGGRR
ncbi:PorT family protein [Mucilaginibacter achroorhodeus]|uniref:PorT family protein n=1 Tax=Mucilaginibacter achroorhodeus TaxID=2599294 RepID=A0A563U8W7_9SPHI|nr:outer membrane beta-barrel protein [Mucilaginibacter achroorhodeus]TWR27733.1 PorT family protein [Mucilaginibacter achroorhodeus]